MTTPDIPTEEGVGYGRPPIHSRFQKGKSGNPSGRPKGRKGTKTHLEEAMTRKMTMVVNGKRRRVTVEEAVIMNFAHAALKDYRAAEKFLKLSLHVRGDHDLEPEEDWTSPEMLDAIIEKATLLRDMKRGVRRRTPPGPPQFCSPRPEAPDDQPAEAAAEPAVPADAGDGGDAPDARSNSEGEAAEAEAAGGPGKPARTSGSGRPSPTAGKAAEGGRSAATGSSPSRDGRGNGPDYDRSD